MCVCINVCVCVGEGVCVCVCVSVCKRVFLSVFFMRAFVCLCL